MMMDKFTPKKLTKLFMVLVIVTASLNLTAQTATAPALGDGTVGNPYQIATLNNLYWIYVSTTRWASNYKQTADIDASTTSTWDSGKGWKAIGTHGGTLFTGSYDGQGKTISGLFLNRTAMYQGLFGETDGANIKNLGLTNVNITGSIITGALVGYQKGATIITNCYSTGTVSGTSAVGGLIGSMERINPNNPELNQSYSTCAVNGTGSGVGGLVGSLQSSCIIKESSSTGTVTGGSSVGGLVGSTGPISSITNCYSRSNVIGTDEVGGLIGKHSNSVIANCYATGTVSATPGVKMGGLVGDRTSSGTVTNCFWDKETSGMALGTPVPEIAGIGKTTSEMKQPITFYEGTWDFIYETTNGTSNIWGLNPVYNDGYPFLIIQGNPALNIPYVKTLATSAITATTATGNGDVKFLGSPNPTQHGLCWNTTGNPTTADSKTESGAKASTGTFTGSLTGLTANTTYYVRAYATNAQGTTYGAEDVFTSFIMDGDGSVGNPYQLNSLSSLQWLMTTPTLWTKNFIQTVDIDATGASDMTPIGSSQVYSFKGTYNGNGKTITGLSIDKTGYEYVGLFGHTSGATITNTHLVGANFKGLYYIGGLVGYTANSTSITNCSTTGTIVGNAYSGGLVGLNHSSSSILQCYSECSVSETPDEVGLLGYNGGVVGYNAATVTNCYATGAVSGSENIGGGVGYSSNVSSISNSYATGVTTGTLSVGGFIGKKQGGTVTNCFWNTETTGKETSVGGTGLTTIEMKDLSIYLDASWDFLGETANGTNNYWGINPTNNNGAPFLAWQGFTHIHPLIIKTNAVSSIGVNTATANGNIGSLGVSNPTEHGFCWNTTGNVSTADNKTQRGTATLTGPFTSSIIGLAPNTTYYLKAYAVGSTTVYGEEVTFTTSKQTLALSGSFTALDKAYDKNYNATIDESNVSLTGVDPNYPNVSINKLFFGFTNYSVGNDILVKINSGTLMGTDAGKYTLSTTGSPTTTADITARELSVLGSFTANDKTFNGDNVALINQNSLYLAGVIGGDVATLSNIVLEFNDAIVGNNKTVSIASADLSGYRSNNYTLILTGAPTTTANITGSQFAVTVSKTGNGSTTPAVGSALYNQGSTVSLTATPDGGYDFEKWIVNGVDNLNSNIDLYMDKAYTVEAVFSLTTSVNSVEDIVIQAYPNPTSGLVHIKSNQIIDQISVSSIAGKLYEPNFDQSELNSTVNLANYPAGIYILNVKSEGAIYFIKVVKQ